MQSSMGLRAVALFASWRQQTQYIISALWASRLDRLPPHIVGICQTPIAPNQLFIGENEHVRSDRSTISIRTQEGQKDRAIRTHPLSASGHPPDKSLAQVFRKSLILRFGRTGLPGLTRVTCGHWLPAITPGGGARPWCAVSAGVANRCIVQKSE